MIRAGFDYDIKIENFILNKQLSSIRDAENISFINSKLSKYLELTKN